MSFTPGFAPDAESQWQELDFELQELVLDEMEKLVAAPPVGVQGLFYRDFAHDRAGVRNYIFLRLTMDWKGRKITIIGIHHHVGPIKD